MFQMINVNLVKSVTYQKNGVMVIVPEDTEVQCDPVNSIGIWNGDRFDLFKDEYCLTN
jgi:hypothetical protein